MSEPVPIQLGLYGGSSEISDVHVVAAHTRVLADGSTTFVAEHLRWNRGRQAEGVRTRRLPEAPRNHPSLFAEPPAPVSEVSALSVEPTPPSVEPTPPSVEPKPPSVPDVGQLGLWETRS